LVVAALAQRPAILVAGPDGKSEGTFLLPSGVLQPYALAIADLDGDGRPDLLVRHNGGIEVLMNRTARSCEISFEARDPVQVCSGPSVVADLDGDGRLDVATICSVQGNLSILLGNGDGTFQPPTTIPATSLPFPYGAGNMSIAAGDLDRDDKIDLVVSMSET